MGMHPTGSVTSLPSHNTGRLHVQRTGMQLWLKRKAEGTSAMQESTARKATRCLQISNRRKQNGISNGQPREEELQTLKQKKENKVKVSYLW